jgi:hypothetical protein
MYWKLVFHMNAHTQTNEPFYLIVVFVAEYLHNKIIIKYVVPEWKISIGSGMDGRCRFFVLVLARLMGWVGNR